MSNSLKKGSGPNRAKHLLGSPQADCWGQTPFAVGMVVLAIAASMASGSICQACNIPVFRYALERWQSDDYEVISFHQVPPTEVDLRFQDEIQRGNSNLRFLFSDLLEPSNPHRQILESIGKVSSTEQSHFVVRAPRQSSRADFVYHGRIAPGSASLILDSPSRRELSRRLLSGHAIVWLMIQSENELANQQTRQLLGNRIATLASQIELPEGIGQPGSELYSEVPLILRFSLLEIGHDDPQERFLRQLFSNSGNRPVVVPVFGRGRALELIHAQELTDSIIEDVTTYLCGACSCQVKDRNPGFDLLLQVDWERELFGDDPAPPILPTGDRHHPKTLAIPPGKSSNP